MLIRTLVQTGFHRRHHWLETDHDLREFLALCPDSILRKHIAITAVDSGSFNPSDQDRAAGWSASGGIAYSPRLNAVKMLPPDCCCRCSGFDEWYIYATEAPQLGSICHGNVFETTIAPPNVFQFINFGGFRFSDQALKAIIDLFWKQVEWMQPESYLGDGDNRLVFVSSDDELFRNVEIILSSSPSRSRDCCSGPASSNKIISNNANERDFSEKRTAGDCAGQRYFSCNATSQPQGEIGPLQATKLSVEGICFFAAGYASPWLWTREMQNRRFDLSFRVGQSRGRHGWHARPE
jgi:hypothetical protein